MILFRSGSYLGFYFLNNYLWTYLGFRKFTYLWVFFCDPFYCLLYYFYHYLELVLIGMNNTFNICSCLGFFFFFEFLLTFSETLSRTREVHLNKPRWVCFTGNLKVSGLARWSSKIEIYYLNIYWPFQHCFSIWYLIISSLLTMEMPVSH